MYERIVGAAAIVGSVFALVGIKTLELPWFITAPLALLGGVVFLGGTVFLFSEGPILKSTHRVKTASRASRKDIAA
jgi:hypothetical protein